MKNHECFLLDQKVILNTASEKKKNLKEVKKQQRMKKFRLDIKHANF